MSYCIHPHFINEFYSSAVANSTDVSSPITYQLLNLCSQRHIHRINRSVRRRLFYLGILRTHKHHHHHFQHALSLQVSALASLQLCTTVISLFIDALQLVYSAVSLNREHATISSQTMHLNQHQINECVCVSTPPTTTLYQQLTRESVSESTLSITPECTLLAHGSDCTCMYHGDVIRNNEVIAQNPQVYEYVCVSTLPTVLLNRQYALDASPTMQLYQQQINECVRVSSPSTTAQQLNDNSTISYTPSMAVHDPSHGQNIHQLVPANYSGLNTRVHSTRKLTINCCLSNVRSLCNKALQVAEFIISHEFQIFFICETWLKNENEYDNAVLTQATPVNFQYLSIPRNGKRGGGLAVLYHKSLKLTSDFNIPTFRSFEVAIFKLSVHNKTVTIILIYRPPNTSINDFFNDFDELCTLLFSLCHFIILGDFNIPKAQMQNFDQILSSHELQQLVVQATHSSGNLLDLLIVRRDSSLIPFHHVMESIADHNSIAFTITLDFSPTCGIAPSREIVSFRKIRNIVHDDFASDITNTVVLPVLGMVYGHFFTEPSLAGVSSVITEFNNRLLSVLDSHAPLIHKYSRIRSATLPWWTSAIYDSRRQLRKAEKNWRKSKLTVHRDIYVSTKKAHHKAIAMAQKEHINTRLVNLSVSSKEAWRVFHNILGRHISSPCPDHSSMHQLVNDFNIFFLDKVKSLRSLMARDYPIPFLSPPVLPSRSNCTSSLDSFENFSNGDVYKALKCTLKKHSPADPIPTFLIRDNLKLLLPVISTLMRTVLKVGIPAQWKHNIITPLLKKSSLNKDCLTNYRPVSQLPSLSKVAERLVYNQLSQYLEVNDLMDNYQTAYRCHHSCETALLYITDFALHSMDEGNVTILVMLDLSSAFDGVDKHILINIIRHLGVSGSALSWIQNYLSNRTQSVKISNTISETLPVKFGVPQGSVLGPLLFSIYMIGLRDVIAKHNVHYILYADDIQLFLSCTPQTLSTAILLMEECIQDIFDWLCMMKLSLNPKKTEVILLGRKRDLSQSNFPGIVVCNSLITPSKHVRSLGVILDPTLSMESNVKKVRSAAFSRLRLIARVKKCLHRGHITTLVRSLVLSHVNYCISLLSGINMSLSKRLQQIINASIRMTHNIRKRETIPPEIAANGWLPFEVRMKLGILRILFFLLRHRKPTFLYSLVSSHTTGRSLRSDDQLLLAIPRTRRKIGDRAFRVFGPRLWNDLSLETRKQMKYSSFMTDCTNCFTRV